MCESKIILIQGDSEDEVMADVVKVFVKDKSIICMDISGLTREFSDVVIDEIDSLKHLILIRKD